MRITLCARSKILELLRPGSSFRIEVTEVPLAGQHIDLIPNSAVEPNDCIILDVPRIVSSYSSVMLLVDKVIDYDYDAEEFIISNRAVK